MEPILEMAKDLAYAIQQDERYIRTQMAQAAADEDEELQGLIGEFNLKRIAINNETTKEDKDGEKDVYKRQVFRQAMESAIVANAHRIVAGEMPVFDKKEGDFFFMPQPGAQDVTDTLLDLCARRLPNRYGFTVFSGIQVLCPGRKGELGTRELNVRLQALLNPEDAKKKELNIEGGILRVGDKVMHTRNNYDIGWTRDDGEVGSGAVSYTHLYGRRNPQARRGSLRPAGAGTVYI